MLKAMKDIYATSKARPLLAEFRSDLAKINYGVVAAAFSVGSLAGFGLFFYPERTWLVDYYLFAFPCLAAIIGGIGVLFSQPERSKKIAYIGFVVSAILLFIALLLYLKKAELLDAKKYGLSYRAFLAYSSVFVSICLSYLKWEGDHADLGTFTVVWVVPILTISAATIMLCAA